MSSKLTTTRNYDLFEVCAFNRNVGKLTALKKSMETHGYIPAYPLHCIRNGDGKLRIKAGQHRFVTAKALGIPVVYVECQDHAEINELEKATNPWTLRDYVTSFVKTGSQEHLALQEFSDRTGIGISQAASLLVGESATSANQGKKLKEGTYTIGDTSFAEKVGGVIMACRNMNLSFATHRCFIGAISLCCRIPDFVPETFLHRLAINSGLAKPQPTVDAFLATIEDVYNRQSHKKIALAFLAREAARERSAEMCNARNKKK